MTFMQKLFMKVLPKSWAEQMRADSEAWRVRCCTCGESRSIWELGGIRWKAYSSGKRTLIRCTRCGMIRVAAVEKTKQG
jgi:hypothetical protein